MNCPEVDDRGDEEDEERGDELIASRARRTAHDIAVRPFPLHPISSISSISLLSRSRYFATLIVQADSHVRGLSILTASSSQNILLERFLNFRDRLPRMRLSENVLVFLSSLSLLSLLCVVCDREIVTRNKRTRHEVRTAALSSVASKRVRRST